MSTRLVIKSPATTPECGVGRVDHVGRGEPWPHATHPPRVAGSGLGWSRIRDHPRSLATTRGGGEGQRVSELVAEAVTASVTAPVENTYVPCWRVGGPLASTSPWTTRSADRA